MTYISTTRKYFLILVMDKNGIIKTSVSLSSSLWNEIQEAISSDEIGFSRWVQKSSRLMLKTIKMRNVKEFINSLDESEIELLKKELKKRS